jgi:hypothetical protein
MATASEAEEGISRLRRIPTQGEYRAEAKTKIILNFDAARKFNLHFPQDLIRQRKETIGN